MEMARRALTGLAWLFVLAVAVQFFLAGLGTLGGESIEAHRIWGFSVMHLIPILMLIAGTAGKAGVPYVGLTVVLLVLVFIQSLWADEGLDPQWLRSFHIFDALLIFGLGHYLAQRATRLMRGAEA
jgi:hypothetical protein